MNILIITGSGIKSGNTDRLSDAFMEGAREAGHHVEKVFMGNKMIQGCMGCGACQKENHQCAIKDDMQKIYPLFEACDMVVLASPLYFWSISGKLNSFIDRLYAVSKEDKYPERNVALLMTAGDDRETTFDHAVQFYHVFAEALGWKDLGTCLAGGCIGGEGERRIDERYLKEAYEFGKKLNSKGE